MHSRLQTSVVLAVLVLVASGLLTGTAVAATPTAPDATSQQTADTCNYEQLYEQNIGSVVQVTAGPGQGSGFVYNRTGNDTSYIVTNEHVVGDTATTEIQFTGDEVREGTVVGTTAYSDLAVIRVNETPGYATALPTADNETVPGQRVAALGTPFALRSTITAGIVSGVDRSLPTERGTTIPDAIQTDAAINPGNSGGPLVDCSTGAVVGVNTAGGAENIGFAIPAAIVDRISTDLIRNGTVDYGFLGARLQGVTPAVAEANDLESAGGVMVVERIEGVNGTSALQPATGTAVVNDTRVPVGGDVIVAIDDEAVQRPGDLVGYLLTKTDPGDTVELQVRRDGELRTVNVTLTNRPEELQG